jgi:hypothetical protein
MNRRLLIIAVAGIGILAIIAGALVWAVKKQNANSVPPVTGPQIKLFTPEVAVSPISSVDGNALWYFSADNRLYRINADGSGLTEFPLPPLGNQRIVKTLWPLAGDNLDFISITSQETSVSGKVYYNSALKTYVSLSANIQSIDWMGDSKRVGYIWQSADKSSQQLVIANPDSSGFVNVSSVFYPDLVVKASADQKTVLLYRSQIEGPVNKIYSVNLDTKEITTIVEEGKNLEAAWISPTQFLFTQATAAAYPSVYLYNTATRNATPLAINTTLEKITVSKDGKSLYAAVPKIDNSGDSFIKIDLATFKNEEYFVPTENIRAKNLVVLGSTVFFINTADGKIYKIE